MNTIMWKKVYIVFLFFIFGIIFLLLAFSDYHLKSEQRQIVKTGYSTEAVIADFQRTNWRAFSSKTVFVTYTNHLGETRKQSLSSSYSKDMKIGDKIRVFYSPESNNKRIYAEYSNTVTSIISNISFGIIMFALSIIMFFKIKI